jgi:hypothetical protein
LQKQDAWLPLNDGPPRDMVEDSTKEVNPLLTIEHRKLLKRRNKSDALNQCYPFSHYHISPHGSRGTRRGGGARQCQPHPP